MNNDMINMNENMEKISQYNIKLDNDISKYKEHIIFLTEINQKLMEELEQANDKEQQLKEALNQENENIPDFINDIRKDMDIALKDLELGLNSK